MVAALASSDFDTVDGLLRGSLQRKPVAIAAMGMVKLYPFADPAFDPYLIRTVGFGDRLASTTALTPVKHIFHGPNIGAPLLESLNARDEHDINSNISIVLKQLGKPMAGLIKQSGEEAVVDTMAKKPESIETLFKTVALVGAFEKTIDLSERVTAKEDRRLDLHWSNIMLDDDGSLGLIDQMTYLDIAHRPDTNLDITKARNSVVYLREAFTKLIGDHNPELLQQVENASTAASEVLCHAQFKLQNPDEQLAYLQQHLTPPETEQWRGLESSHTIASNFDQGNKLAFGKVTSVSAARIDMKQSKPQALLDTLNELHDKAIAKTIG